MAFHVSINIIVTIISGLGTRECLDGEEQVQIEQKD